MKTIGYLFPLAVTLLAGCGLVEDWSEGDTETRTIQITDKIATIEVRNIFVVTLIQDDSSYLNVTCGENFQAKMQIKMVDGVLVLDHNISHRWLYGYDKVKAEIHLGYLPAINVHNPAKIETLGTFTSDSFYLIDWEDFSECDVSIDVKSLKIETSDDHFGVFIVKGKSGKTEMSCRGSSRFDCSALETDTCYLSQESTVDLPINVNQLFDVTIKSSGNVYYSGNPTIKLTRWGSGELIKEN